jgi:hypothetical protein
VPRSRAPQYLWYPRCIRPRDFNIHVPSLRGGKLARPAPNVQLSVRTLLVLLLACLTLCGQSFALASQEESHHESGHCCLLCHVGPLPFLQTTVTATVTPTFLVAWLAPAPDFEPIRQAPLFACSSRGPPAA